MNELVVVEPEYSAWSGFYNLSYCPWCEKRHYKLESLIEKHLKDYDYYVVCPTVNVKIHLDRSKSWHQLKETQK